jgi:DHA1 family bicyclomycin/chloramphenicol resistance-like MFS transporter
MSWFALDETHHAHLRTPLAWRSCCSNYLAVLGKRDFQLLAAAVSCNFAGFFLYIPRHRCS